MRRLLPLVTLTLCLLLALLWPGGPAAASTREADSQCRAAGVAVWKAGDKRMEYYTDGHGHDVEVWCASGVFTAHYDLRIDSDPMDAHGIAAGKPSDAVGQSLVIAGCFFNYGKNVGPDIHHDPSGAYSKVEWTNSGPPDRPETYHFSYDFRTRMVTITVTAPCGLSATKVVAPQVNFQKLAALLPDPPAGSCPLKTPASTAPPGVTP